MKLKYFFVLFIIVSCSKKEDSGVQLNNAAEQQAAEIAYGKELILHTSYYYGPKGTLSQTSNGMNCTNCHLQAGTVDYGNSYKAVFANYPKFRERSGSIETLEKRISDCFQRSLNGDSLQIATPEMQAMVAYISSVGKDVPKNTVPHGSGIKKLKLLNRAANPEKGKTVYHLQCASCHGSNGTGKAAVNSKDYFEFPPLWGNQSYNSSAGLNRIQNLAGFVHANMPKDLATAEKPVLTEEEAWDVAAFIISKPRPQKFFSQDWPNLKTKPVDYAFGPFADNFSEKQHRYGPFQPILDAREKN